MCEWCVEILSFFEDDGVIFWFEGEYRVCVRWNVVGEDGGCGGCWWVEGWVVFDYGVEILIVGYLIWFFRGDKKVFFWEFLRREDESRGDKRECWFFLRVEGGVYKENERWS